MLAARRMMLNAAKRITDTFNRANTTAAAGLGTTSDGNWTWTDITTGSPRWQILSDEAHCTQTSGVLSIALIDFGDADGSLSLDLAQISGGIASGLTFRITDISNNYNIQALSGTNASGCYRYVADGAHLVGSAFTVHLNDTISVVMNGSSVTVKVNGTTVSSFTDSTYTTNTKHGIIATGGISVDNFNWIAG